MMITLLVSAVTAASFSIGATAQQVSIVTLHSPMPTNEFSYVNDDGFKDAVLNSSNFFRRQHNAAEMSWNESLAEYAQFYNDGCIIKHSGGSTGENLAEGYVDVASAIDAWGNERNKYDFENPQYSEPTGHFTQLVWRASRTVGCSRKWCDDDFTGWYLVCEYFPPGNIIGHFDQEVQPQGSYGTPSGTGEGDLSKDGSTDNHEDLCPSGADCSAAVLSHSTSSLQLGWLMFSTSVALAALV